MQNYSSYLPAVMLILSCNITQPASSEQKPQPITAGRITYLPRYAITYYLENGRKTDTLEGLGPEEKVRSVDITNGRIESFMFLPKLNLDEIPAYIEKEMRAKDPAYPESSIYKEVAASMRILQQQKEQAKASSASVLPAGTRRRYRAYNMKTGEHRIMAHKDDLRPDEQFNGEELWL